MITSVVAALRLFGSSNAGTPFETASTPVSAVQPDANARMSRKTSASPPVSVDVTKLVARALGGQAVAERELGEPDREHHEHAKHEAVSRKCERATRLLDAA